jgi:hypothetical protein
MDPEGAVSGERPRVLTALVIASVLAGPFPAANLFAQGAAARQIAPTLLRPASATKAPDANGFLQRWLILDPIRVSGQLTDSVPVRMMHTMLRRFDGRLVGKCVGGGLLYAIMCPPGGSRCNTCACSSRCVW